MTGEALGRMLSQARTLRAGFAATAPEPWDATTAAAELAVQLGHLAQCVGRRHGLDLSEFEDPARPITDISDELADVALAILSIAVLCGGEPPAPPEAAGGPGRAPGAMPREAALLLVLVIAAGRLAESAMVAGGYRHRPSGNMPAVAEAAGTALAAAGQLATATGVDLPTAFDAMSADAADFLAARSARAGGGPA